MGYEQAAQAFQSVQPVEQEPISTVLAQALGQAEDVEERLKGLRDRLRMGPSDTLGKSGAAIVPPSGIISKSNGLRNVSSRLQELCSELETLL